MVTPALADSATWSSWPVNPFSAPTNLRTKTHKSAQEGFSLSALVIIFDFAEKGGNATYALIQNLLDRLDKLNIRPLRVDPDAGLNVSFRHFRAIIRKDRNKIKLKRGKGGAH
jgi:hypothetical protein